MRYEAVVLVRRAEEAEARAALVAAEERERLRRAEVERTGAVVEALEARMASSRARSGEASGPLRAARLQAADEHRRALDRQRRQAAAEQARAGELLLAARAALERTRVALSEAVRRRQGAEAEARRRRRESARLRERRDEASSADAVLAMRKST